MVLDFVLENWKMIALAVVLVAVLIWAVVWATSDADGLRVVDREGMLVSETQKGVLTSGADIRFATNVGLSSTENFLGGHEPPVFYNVGDLASAKAAIQSTMGRAQGKGAEGMTDPGSVPDKLGLSDAKLDAALAGH
jgi:hypothetical protein